MKTTLDKIREHSPCAVGWKNLLDHLDKTQADDEPLSLLTVLESNGLDDALWCLRAIDGYETEIRLYLLWCARQVQHLMTDKRSIDALNVSERHLNGQANDSEMVAAQAAAEAAVQDAVQNAARDVAQDAAWAAAHSASWDAAWAAAHSASWAAAHSASWDAAWAAAHSASWDAAQVAARDAARAAAWAAAQAAAHTEAWDAAWGAARGAQEQRLRMMLTENSTTSTEA